MFWSQIQILDWHSIDFVEFGIKRMYWIFVFWQKVAAFSLELEFKDNSQFSNWRLVLIGFYLTKRQLIIELWSCMDRKVRIGIIICIWKSERRHPACGEDNTFMGLDRLRQIISYQKYCTYKAREKRVGLCLNPIKYYEADWLWKEKIAVWMAIGDHSVYGNLVS